MTLKKTTWYHHHLPAIAYVLQTSAGNLVFEGAARAELEKTIELELSDALEDPTTSEWETEIAKIVQAEDTEALYQLVEQSAFASRRAAIARAVKSPTRSETSRENGKKGGRPRKVI